MNLRPYSLPTGNATSVIVALRTMRMQSPSGSIYVLAFLFALFLAGSASAGVYLEDKTPDLVRILPPPPEDDSPETRHELDELLQMQRDRSPRDVEYARANIPIGVEQFAAALGDEAEVRKSLPKSVKSLFDTARADERSFSMRRRGTTTGRDRWRSTHTSSPASSRS